VVAFRGLLEELLIFCELLGIREGDAVYPLEGIVIRVAEPVGCRVLHRSQHGVVDFRNLAHLGDHECLDASCMRHMRAHAEVDHRSTAIYRGRGVIWDLCLDKVELILVVLN
jgi:hypothetical protein